MKYKNPDSFLRRRPSSIQEDHFVEWKSICFISLFSAASTKYNFIDPINSGERVSNYQILLTRFTVIASIVFYLDLLWSRLSESISKENLI
jgi:hypothetical protein